MLFKSITHEGRLFQITIVDGKKECRKTFVRHETVLSLCGCPLVQLLLGVVYLFTGITTKLFKILYSIIALDIRLRCSSVGHPSFCSIDVTLEEYENSRNTNLAALLCTASSKEMFCLVYGDHTVLAYSTIGRTIIL